MTLLSTNLLPRAAYVHLPFCRRRCFYCDFPIQVVGAKPGAADAAAETYCALLRREIAATPSTDSAPLRSLYFGGGTPSLTPPALLAGVIEAVRELPAGVPLRPWARLYKGLGDELRILTPYV